MPVEPVASSDKFSVTFVWTLTAEDIGGQVQVFAFDEVAVQAVGGRVDIEGSIDGENWVLAASVIDVSSVPTYFKYLRPTNIDSDTVVTLFAHKRWAPV